MIINEKKLKEFSALSTDGPVGKIDTLIFDPHDWKIRYVVVHTGHWFSHKKALLSPLSVKDINLKNKTISFNLTKDRIQKGPDVNPKQTVTREKEELLANYYAWPFYWSEPDYMKPDKFSLEIQPEQESSPERIAKEEHKLKPFLRSLVEVTGFHIEATNGDIGRVDDYVIDKNGWLIRYLIVETHFLPRRKKVLVSPEWISTIRWENRHVRVDLDKETIDSSPHFDPKECLTRDYEEMLYSYYNRAKYWSEPPIESE